MVKILSWVAAIAQVVVVGSAAPAVAQEGQPPRFQIYAGVISGMQGNPPMTIMLDTQTGDTWGLAFVSQTGAFGWMKLNYMEGSTRPAPPPG